MPQLPEVHTVVHSLSKKIINLRPVKYNELWHKVNYSKNSKLLHHKISDTIIKNIDRRGKYIVIDIEDAFIIFHLRMTGYLYHSKAIPLSNKHIRCYFTFSDNSFLIFEDIRKFGGFYFTKSLNILKDKIGLDALDPQITGSWLFGIMKKKEIKIKYFLLNQKFICGLGNIYIDEILWESMIHPLCKTNKINIKKTYKLVSTIRKVLNKSIRYHGTTFMNFKFDNMKTGNYKSKLNVFDRKNKACKKCKNIITKKHICGRGTYFCPNCQKL